MTLQEASEYLQIPKKRLWRAIKSGQLTAEQVQKGQRWEYRVTRGALDAWNDLEQVVPAGTRHGTTCSERSVPGNETRSISQERHGTTSPPAEVYFGLIDRLSRAERRSVELELQLQQSQRLLTENAESITEREAFVQQARAQLETLESEKGAEVERLRAELETTRRQLEEAQRPSGLLSWLGLRKKRTAPASVDKAV